MRSATARSRSPTNARWPASCARTWRRRSSQLKLIIGAEFRLTCGLRFVALATDRRGYGAAVPPHHAAAGARPPRASYALTRADLEDAGLAQLLRPVAARRRSRSPRSCALARTSASRPRVRIAVELLREGADRARLATLAALGAQLRPAARRQRRRAHARARAPALQDALTAIRLNVPVARSRLRAVPQRRAPPARARAAGAALSAASCWRRRVAVAAALPLLARRAALRVSARARAAGRDADAATCASYGGGRAAALAARACRRQSARAHRARARAHRRAALRAVLPHRARHRRVRARARASCARGAARPPTRACATAWASPRSTRARRGAAVRALHLARAQRAAGHRHRLRARAARGGHPVHLRQVRPRARGARRHGHHATGRAARCAISARRSGSTLADSAPPGARSCSGGTARERIARAAARGGLRSRQPRGWHACCRWRRSWCLPGFPRHLSQHVGGFVISRGPARGAGADRERRDARAHRHPVGQGRSRRPGPAQGRPAGARHADRAQARIRCW